MMFENKLAEIERMIDAYKDLVTDCNNPDAYKNTLEILRQWRTELLDSIGRGHND